MNQPDRTHRAAAAAIHLVGVLLSLLLLAPLWLDPGIGDGDPSWQLALHDAFAAGRRFGIDVVWTYGPWGMLWNEVHHPDTWATVLVVRSAFAVAWWVALHAAAGQVAASRRGQAALTLVLLLIPAYSWDSIAYQACVIVWLLWRTADERRDLAVAASFLAVLSWLALGKFLMLLCLGAVVASSAARDGLRRRAIVLSTTWLISTGLAWVTAGQAVGDFATWVRLSWEVASGFAQGLTRSGAFTEVVVYWSFALLLLGSVQALLPHPRTRRARLLDLAGLLAPTVVAMRHSFTRHDTGHVLIGASFLVALAALLLPAARRRVEVSRIWRVVPGLAMASILLLNALLQPVDAVIEVNRPLLLRLPGKLEVALALVRRDDGPFERIGAHRAALAAAEPLGPIDGPVDIYPHAQATLLRHEVEYRPRPVIQSNTAYTPRLNRLNAQHLASSRGPQTVLFDIDELEDHHPAAFDSLSLLELIRSFEVTDGSGRFVNLERRSEPLPLDRSSVLDRSVEAGEWIELPALDAGRDRAVLWLRATRPSSLLERLTHAIWKRPLLRVDVQHLDGDLRSWFVAAGVAEEGLILAPTLSSRLDFVRLQTAQPDRRPVRAVRLGVQGRAPSRVGAPFRVRLDRIAFPTGPVRALPEPAGVLEEAAPPFGSGEDHPHWLGQDEETRLFAHAPSKLEVALRPGLSTRAGPVRAEVRFGLLPGAWEGEQATDGVTFEISLRQGTSESVLWQRRLTPSSIPGDRREQTAVFAVPGGAWREPGAIPWDSARPKLVLRTLPGEHASSDWSYWSDLRLR